MITERFTKMTLEIPLRMLDAYNLVRDLDDDWVFKYGSTETVLADNGSLFSSTLFRRVGQVMGIANEFSTTYQPQTNVQTERYNRSIHAVLSLYMREHQIDREEFVRVVTYEYKT